MTIALKNIVKKLLRQFGAPARAILLQALSAFPLNIHGPLVARNKKMVVLRNHYYSCVPDLNDMPDNFWSQESEMIGIDLRAEETAEYLQANLADHIGAFRRYLPSIYSSPGAEEFFLLNGTYMAVDAHIYFAHILYLKPRNIIEIGSGNSTLVALKAVEILQEMEHECTITCIEPFPHAYLKELSKTQKIKLIENRIQEIDLAFFDILNSNDILFIDSTHVLREASDVKFEYLEILPRLKPGVYIHIHDISLPKPYPQTYMKCGFFWNEQYILQAYLINNAKLQVVWPGNYMMQRYTDLMYDTFPEIALMRERFPSSEPTSFWIKTIS